MCLGYALRWALATTVEEASGTIDRPVLTPFKEFAATWTALFFRKMTF